MGIFDKKGGKGEPKPSESVILGTCNLTAQLPNGRSINIQCYVYYGEDKASVDERLDTLQEVIERQRVRCEVPTLEAAREQKIKALEDYRTHLSALETKQKQPGQTLSSQERMTLSNKATNIKRMLEDIEKGDKAIAEAKEKGGLVKKQAGARG